MAFVTYDPNDPDRRMARSSSGLSGAAMGAIAIALVLFIGVLVWAFTTGTDRQTAGDSPKVERTSPAPTTTGKGETRVAPGPDQNTPNPTPPAKQTPPAAK
jgi:hypothetical protein